jgi:Reverse transcriptase (RNA-dependent DNA polymerase)
VTRLVSDHDQPHIRSPSATAAPTSRLRLPQQHGFRPGLDAKMPLRQVYWHVTQHGRREVVDADLRDYFNSIPHAPLMRSLSRRIADGRIFHVIKRWLTAPVVEVIDGRSVQTAEARRTKRGTPQGGVISPLLANCLLPALPASLARPWPSGPTRCPRRQLSRRFRHLLPTWQRAGGDGADGDVDDAPSMALRAAGKARKGSTTGRNAKTGAAQRTAPGKPKSCSQFYSGPQTAVYWGATPGTS